MSVPDDAHFSMMVFRIGIPDLHQTVSGYSPASGQTDTLAKSFPTLNPRSSCNLTPFPTYP